MKKGTYAVFNYKTWNSIRTVDWFIFEFHISLNYTQGLPWSIENVKNFLSNARDILYISYVRRRASQKYNIISGIISADSFVGKIYIIPCQNTRMINTDKYINNLNIYKENIKHWRGKKKNICTIIIFDIKSWQQPIQNPSLGSLIIV